MIYTKKQIETLNRVDRLKLINSSTGIKPANLIGSIDSEGRTNLAVFSSIVHLGSSPALLGFISRPRSENASHTYRNILENKTYTINHIHPEFVKNAHYTSAKFPKEKSEFEACNFSEEYLSGFEAPFVAESTFKMGMRFKEAIDIKLNGTVLVVGEIESLIVPDDAFSDGDIDLEFTDGVGISGLNSYYSLKRIGRFPLAKPEEIPNFNK
jgi:flavin reductase (DIM6/NTAB) family NADH-FMN oxidoreductase RutF